MKKLAFLLLCLAVLFGVPIYATAASLPCTVTIDANGNGTVSCAGSIVVPPPTVSCVPPLLWNGSVCVAPALPPAVVTPPADCSTRTTDTMKIGGTNNWIRGSGEIHVFALPLTWNDGLPVRGASVAFATSPGLNPIGASYEVSFSRCAGDFDYYNTDAASFKAYGQTFFPCGIVSGPDLFIAWSTEGPSIYTCQIPPGEQWYMNWRVKNCSGVCGQTFTTPRG